MLSHAGYKCHEETRSSAISHTGLQESIQTDQKKQTLPPSPQREVESKDSITENITPYPLHTPIYLRGLISGETKRNNTSDFTPPISKEER